MIIRNATEEDYQSLITLYNGFVGEDRYSGHDNDSFKEVVRNPNNHIFIAEDNGEIIGFATFSVRWVIRYPKPIAELDELYVIPEFRNRGIGKKLIEKVLQTARNLDCHRLFIESQYKHKDAHKFYEHLGFVNNGYHFIKDLK